LRIGMPLALLPGAVTLALVDLDNAQTSASSKAAQPEAYRPSFGDLMTIVIQPRHIKLGLAGQEKNWTYAAYEFRELQSAFGRVAHAVPTYRSMNTADLISGTIKAPMDDVAAAIKAGDAARFAETYAQLTATCNACHQATDQAPLSYRRQERRRIRIRTSDRQSLETRSSSTNGHHTSMGDLHDNNKQEMAIRHKQQSE
jgi:mono/diheme cytochrome c family protein